MTIYICEEGERKEYMGGTAVSMTIRPAETIAEVIGELSKRYAREFPAGIRGGVVPAADLTFRWMRWEDGEPGVYFEVPDYLEKELDLAEGMMTDILEYIAGEKNELWYSKPVKGRVMAEDFILDHQPVCLDRMTVRGAAGDTYDLDEIYRDLVLRGELEPDKYVAFGWDASAGDDRDSPYGMSKAFHVVTIPAFMDDPDVPRKAIEYMVWCAVRRLSAGPFWEPDDMEAPRRLGSGIVWLYEMMTALSEDEQD